MAKVIKLKKYTREAVQKRVALMAGQLKSISALAAANGSAVEIVQQSLALQGALNSLDKVVVADVMRYGLAGTLGKEEADRIIEEFLQLYGMTTGT